MTKSLFYGHHIIGHVPDTWDIVKVDNNLVDSLGGFSCAKTNTIAQGIPHLRPFNITTRAEVVLTPDTLNIPIDFRDDLDRFHLHVNDVLFNNTNSVELVGKTGLVKNEMQVAFSNHINRLRILNPNQMESKWLALALQNLQLQGFFARYCKKWIGQAGFSFSMLSEVDIPLPSITEQRRIISRIEAISDELIEMRHLHDKISNDTEKLPRAFLVNQIQDLYKQHHPNWQKVKIDRRIVDVKSGFACARNNAVQNGIQHLRPFNITSSGEVVLGSDTVQIPRDIHEDINEYFLQPGDILFNNTNSLELVGKSAIVRQNLQVAFSNHINRLRIREPEFLEPEWLVISLRYLFETGYFARNCNRWIGQAGFNISKLAQTEILVPDIEEQRRIIALFQNVQSEIQVMNGTTSDNASLLTDLEGVTLAQAFQGEL